MLPGTELGERRRRARGYLPAPPAAYQRMAAGGQAHRRLAGLTTRAAVLGSGTIHLVSFKLKPTSSEQQALDLLGDRWTLWLLVSIDDRRGSRFTDLAGSPGLSRRVLAERLDRLVDHHLVERRQYQARPVRSRYALTERGLALRRLATQLLHLGAGGSLSAGGSAAHALADEMHASRHERREPPLVMQDGDSHPSDRLLEADPAAAWAIYRETVQSLVRYDDQYRTPLVQTLSTWLGCDASVSVAAAQLHAHRHTIRYRLARITELTGLDVDAMSDRERLQLGLRSLRLFEREGSDLLAR